MDNGTLALRAAVPWPGSLAGDVTVAHRSQACDLGSHRLRMCSARIGVRSRVVLDEVGAKGKQHGWTLDRHSRAAVSNIASLDWDTAASPTTRSQLSTRTPDGSRDGNRFGRRSCDFESLVMAKETK